MGRYGDETGFFWEDVRAGNLPKLPASKGGDGQVRAMRGRAGRAAMNPALVGLPSHGEAPVSDWVCPTTLPRLHDCMIGVDVETTDKTLFTRGPGWCFGDMGGEVIGLSVAWPGGRAYYPFGHADPSADQLDRAHVMAWMADVFRDPTVTVCCYNALYDLGWLRVYGCPYPAGVVHDGLVMAALLDEHRRSYTLESVSKAYGFEGKDETLLKRAASYYHCTNYKAQLRHLPARYVGPYGEEDAALAMALVQTMLPLIDTQELSRVYRLEQRQVPILLNMRNRGVRVDVVGAELLADRWAQQEQELTAEIKRLVGTEVPIWEAAAIAKACDVEGIDYPRTADGAASFTAPWLAARPERWLQHVALQRKLNKATSTFVHGYVLDKHVNGRLHCQFNQLRSEDGGAVSGRYSSSFPNLQNIPTRDKVIGPAMRALFLPEEGEWWCAPDFSQQEPRLTVHYADVINCVGARAAVEQYRTNPRMDYHQFMADLTALDRDRAKTINLAATYGMGAVTLCHRLGLPTAWTSDGRGGRTEVPGEEGLRIMQQYHANAPFVQQLSDACSRRARSHHVIKTIGGRLCRFPPFESPHKALNRLIQGSAADMFKQALADVGDAGIVPLVLVHDELGVSVDGPEAGQRVADMMRDAITLRVPVVVDAALGHNWWEAKQK